MLYLCPFPCPLCSTTSLSTSAEVVSSFFWTSMSLPFVTPQLSGLERLALKGLPVLGFRFFQYSSLALKRENNQILIGKLHFEWFCLPCPDPGFGVHPEAAAPHVVLLRALAQLALPLIDQLLGDGSDVVGFEPAAASDVSDAEIPSLASVAVHVPASQDPRFEAEWKLGQVDESLSASIWGMITERLCHQVDLVEKSGILEAVLHHLYGVERFEGVKVAVDSDCQREIT